MLTDSDRKYLENVTGERGRRWRRIPVVAFIACVLYGLANVFIAYFIGRMNEYTFRDLIVYWSRGIHYEKLYPGYIILAFGRLEAALGCMGLALVLGILASVRGRERARERRMVETLKNAGLW